MNIEQRVEDRTLSSSGFGRFIVPDASFDTQVGDAWRDPDFKDFSRWSLGSGDFGYEDGAGYEAFIRNAVPSGSTSIYVRPFAPFSVKDDNNSGSVQDEFDKYFFEARYDDGFVVYLNGVKVLEVNAPANPAFDSLATASHEATGEYQSFELDAAQISSLLKPSGNLVAVHLLNDSPNSSDLLIGYRFIGRDIIGDVNGIDGVYFTMDGTDPRLSGGQINPRAVKSTGQPFPIGDNAIVLARALLDNQWSPLSRAVFQVAPPTIAVTELNYHPADPSLAELALLPEVEADDFEFIEIQNNGPEQISLAGLRLTSGVTFDFPSQLLDPGDYAVVAANQSALRVRYGNEVPIIGQYNGRLDNGGERIEFTDALGAPLLEFSYRDNTPWPDTADGRGATLVLQDPQTPADQYGKPYRWRGSTLAGGTPGADAEPPIGIVINEILSNPSGPNGRDAIELFNPTATRIDVSGWFVSDAGSNLLRTLKPPVRETSGSVAIRATTSISSSPTTALTSRGSWTMFTFPRLARRNHSGASPTVPDPWPHFNR